MKIAAIKMRHIESGKWENLHLLVASVMGTTTYCELYAQLPRQPAGR